MKNTIYIPTKCKVGFVERNDTYTKKLGYVIYNDGKVWRKETSWENWRAKIINDTTISDRKKEYDEEEKSRILKKYEEIEGKVNNTVKLEHHELQYYLDDWKKIVEKGFDAYYKKERYNRTLESFKDRKDTTDLSFTPIEFDNKPIEGFVLNKKVGGDKYSWNTRNTYCRVYDPRGWEFEIDIINLLYILENTNSIVGKGLEGKFIYGWDGKDLVLLPENCPEFKDMVRFTNEVNKTPIKFSKLKIGYNYYFSDESKSYTYLGVYTYYNSSYNGSVYEEKQFIFSDESGNIKHFKKPKSQYKYLTTEENFNDDYSKLIDKLLDKEEYQKLTVTFEKIKFEDLPKNITEDLELYQLLYNQNDGKPYYQYIYYWYYSSYKDNLHKIIKKREKI